MIGLPSKIAYSTALNSFVGSKDIYITVFIESYSFSTGGVDWLSMISLGVVMLLMDVKRLYGDVTY